MMERILGQLAETQRLHLEAQRERDNRMEHRMVAQEERHAALMRDVLRTARSPARNPQDPSANFPVLWSMDLIRSDLGIWERAASEPAASNATRGIFWAYKALSELSLSGIEENAHAADAACCIQQAVLALAGGDPLPPTSDKSDITAGPPMPRPGGCMEYHLYVSDHRGEFASGTWRGGAGGGGLHRGRPTAGRFQHAELWTLSECVTKAESFEAQAWYRCTVYSAGSACCEPELPGGRGI
eukprot:gene17490-biopygen20380